MPVEQMSREKSLEALRDRKEPWDLLVIGGGATGVGIALDAASRNLDVLLLEQSDFGKGTSSRSTKLIHGGVRYLQQGNLTLVSDALQERARLIRNAPHLVRDRSFLVPCHSFWERIFYGTGMKLYDFLAVRDSFGSSRWLSKSAVADIAPALQHKQLKGAVLYHDGQFDDARLLLSMARSAFDHGACLLNYVQVNQFLKDSSGKVIGVEASDQLTEESFAPHARSVINATGPFSDTVRKLDDQNADKMIAPSQGVHLVVPISFFPGEAAMIVPKTPDGRVIFIIPWHDHAIIGTTDTEIPEAVLEPTAQEDEIQFLLDTSADYLAKPLSRSDVLSIYTGIRPLVKNSSAGRTASLSRDHHIQTSSSGVVTIAGGKWTTVRKMAEDCVDVAVKQANLSAKECVTKNLKLHGHQENLNVDDPRSAYGSDLIALEQLEAEHPSLAEPFSKSLSLRPSEVVWAARNEMAQTLDDVLTRRSRCLFLDARATLAIAPDVARRLAQELNKDESWVTDQVEKFEIIAQHFLP